MAGFQIMKKCSLTPNQKKYVLANYKRMTHREMAFNQKLHPTKVQRNMEFLGLIQIKLGAVKTKVVEMNVNNRLFNVDRYARQVATI